MRWPRLPQQGARLQVHQLGIDRHHRHAVDHGVRRAVLGDRHVQARIGAKDLIEFLSIDTVDIGGVRQAVLLEGFTDHSHRQHVVARFGQRIRHLRVDAVAGIDFRRVVQRWQDHDRTGLGCLECGVIVCRRLVAQPTMKMAGPRHRAIFNMRDIIISRLFSIYPTGSPCTASIPGRVFSVFELRGDLLRLAGDRVQHAQVGMEARRRMIAFRSDHLQVFSMAAICCSGLSPFRYSYTCGW